MKNNSLIYLCLFEMLTVYIMYVNSSQYERKGYSIPKSNTKYISTHNIRHKHHYLNRTLATSKKPYKQNNPTPKVHSHLLTTKNNPTLKVHNHLLTTKNNPTLKVHSHLLTTRPATSTKSVNPVSRVSASHPLNEVTLKKPTDFHPNEVTTKLPAYKEDSHNHMDTTIDLLALTLKNKLLNNEDRSKFNDLSNTNNLAPPSFDSTTKPIDRVHEYYAGRSLPYFDQYLQKDSPHLMQPVINVSSDGSIQKMNELMMKTDRFVNENSDHMDDDEDDDDDDDVADDEEEDEEEDAIAMFDDELSSSTLTSTSMATTTTKFSQETNDSAETSKLNMVRSRSVPYRTEYAAALKSARSPPPPSPVPTIESFTTEDSVQNLQRLASRHKNKVVRDAACRKPMPKVVKVSDVYPTASKIYLPQCTIIHQCAEDTGCCTSPYQKCGPKSSEKIDLYFYTYSTSAIVPGASPHQIEKLGFYNHTECECHEDMPRDDSNVIDTDSKILPDTISVDEEPCLCPTDYAVRRFLNGSCGCDCFDKERDCLRFKKGKEYFSLKDKWCIKIGKCHEPSCEYGKYSPKVGRCPRVNEKSRFF